jgi:hypothetical protein
MGIRLQRKIASCPSATAIRPADAYSEPAWRFVVTSPSAPRGLLIAL